MARGRPRKTSSDDALRAAMNAFWQNGYVGTSMNDLAKQSGMAKPGLYAAFGDKEELYKKALLYYFNKYGGPIMNQLSAARKHYVEDVRDMLVSIAEFTSDENTPSGCFAINAQVDNAYGPDEIRELVEDLRQSRLQFIRERLYKGVSAGQLPEDADIRQLAYFIDGQIAAVAMLGRTGGTLSDLLSMVDLAIRSLPVVDGFDFDNKPNEPTLRQ